MLKMDFIMDDASTRIEELKRRHNAVILVHNYCLPEVQDIADFVGDSLGLSMKASSTDANVIIFCGVTFMAESAKILNPDKTVILPEPESSCAMAAMCSPDQIAKLQKENPGAEVVGYVNSTAACKARMDVCCTSSNAVDIVKSTRSNTVIFVPDRNLGAYAAKNCPDKKVVLWDGFCPVHQSITVEQVASLKAEHPDAIVVAHPECRGEVLDMADAIGSTETMLKCARNCPQEDFIMLTEIGMKHRLEKECPSKKFHFPEHAVCSSMKMISLASVLKALETLDGEVKLDDNIMKDAYSPVKRMIG